MSLAFLLLILAVAAFAAAAVVAMAYRGGTTNAWNAVAVFAIGLIITAYGALEELLSHLGTSGAGSRAWIAILAGLVVAGSAAFYVLRERAR